MSTQQHILPSHSSSNPTPYPPQTVTNASVAGAIDLSSNNNSSNVPTHLITTANNNTNTTSSSSSSSSSSIIVPTSINHDIMAPFELASAFSDTNNISVPHYFPSNSPHQIGAPADSISSPKMALNPLAQLNKSPRAQHPPPGGNAAPSTANASTSSSVIIPARLPPVNEMRPLRRNSPLQPAVPPSNNNNNNNDQIVDSIALVHSAGSTSSSGSNGFKPPPHTALNYSSPAQLSDFPTPTSGGNDPIFPYMMTNPAAASLNRALSTDPGAARALHDNLLLAQNNIPSRTCPPNARPVLADPSQPNPGWPVAAELAARYEEHLRDEIAKTIDLGHAPTSLPPGALSKHNATNVTLSDIVPYIGGAESFRRQSVPYTLEQKQERLQWYQAKRQASLEPGGTVQTRREARRTNANDRPRKGGRFIKKSDTNKRKKKSAAAQDDDQLVQLSYNEASPSRNNGYQETAPDSHQ